ncbi:MAG: twin-arginine translocase TatA/TatE family subunit [Bacteroidales bacterium]|nr:twin-arginine translocase TatA/TatE family subunit [Bacteroidales bacterium]
MNTYAIIPLFLGNIRGWQLLIIVLVILLLFGGKKIPELMKGLGQGIRAFKQGMNEMQQEINRKDDTTDTPAK